MATDEMNGLQQGMTELINNLLFCDTAQAGDFIDESGLLTCGKCLKPKQFKINFPLKGEVLAPIPCDCDREQARIAAEINARENHERKILKIKRKGIFSSECKGGKYETMLIENDDYTNSKIGGEISGYILKWEEMKKNNIGLFLYGNPGTGKTFYAASIVNALVPRGVDAYMITAADIVAIFRAGFAGEQKKEALFDRVIDADLFVIDDLGVNADTSFSNERITDIINKRILSEKPLIITSNLTPQQIKEPANMEQARIFSRMLGACAPLLVEGKDRRRKECVEKTNLFNQILKGNGKTV